MAGCVKCRVMRLCLTGLLIAVSAVAGYCWGAIIQVGGVMDHLDYLVGGLTLVLMIIAIFFAMDNVSSRIEDQRLLDGDELQRLSKLAKAEDTSSRKMELALQELANDNARLRDLLRARDKCDAGATASQQFQQAVPDWTGTGSN